MIRSQNVITSTTWANKPSSYITGQPVFISDAGTKGSHWFYDGTRWKPMNGIAVLATADSISSAINNNETLALQYLMPAGLLQAGDRLRLFVTIHKSGTTDSGTFRLRIGTAGTTADTAVSDWALLGVTTRQAAAILEYRLESATSVQVVGNSAGANISRSYGNLSTSAAASPVTISSASANALYVSLGLLSSGTTDTLQLADASLQLIAKAN